MSRYLLAGLFFLQVYFTLAQSQVKVVDERTGETISGAFVYNEKQSRFTESDNQGNIDLSTFLLEENLFIQHPSYHTFYFKKSDLSASQNTISLKEKIIKIDEVVISASKWEQNESEIPFEILKVGIDEMTFNNVQTAADALETTGQVFVQKSQLGGGSPMIRGFGANAVLIVVDGVRMNNAIFRGGNLQNVISIDPNALESSEVIFGPGAVIYGSDALGGVMDFHTIKPRFSSDNSLKVSGHGFVRYSSANNEKTGSVQVFAGKKKWGYAGNFTYSDFEDLRTGAVRPDKYPEFGKRPEYIKRIDGIDSILQNSDENLQKFSGYKQFNTLQKLSVRFKSESELNYTFNFSTSTDIPRYDRLILYEEGQLKYAQWYYGPQSWMMNALNFNHYRPSGFFDAMKLTLAYQRFQESRHDRKYKDADLRNRTEKVGVVSMNADFEKDINPKNHLYYGLEYLYNHVSSSAFLENISNGNIGKLSTRYPNGGSDVNNLATYISYKRDIKERVFLSAGLRYNFQYLYSSFIDSPFDYNSIFHKSSAVNGNFGLVYRPNSSWILSGMLSSGFRAPNVDDISKVFDSEPGNVVVPNPGLKPEYSYNVEFSFTKVWDDVVELNGNVFYSFLRDAMVRGDFTLYGNDSILYDGELSKVQAIVNSGRANIYGLNFGLKVNFSPYWSGKASINVTEGRDLEEDLALRHTTPVFGLASVEYLKKRFAGEFYFRFNGARSFENLPPSEQSKTHIYSADGSLAWYTLNLRGQYQISDWLSINAALENLLDHHYRTYSSGISAPGRNFVISLKAVL